MDGIILLLILYGIFRAFTNAAKKQQAASGAKHKGGRAGKAADAAKAQAGSAANSPARPQARPQPTRPAPSPASVFDTPREPLGEGMSSYRPMVSTLTEMPASRMTGSLGASSMEGRDTCDPSLGHDRPRAEGAASVYAREVDGAPLIAASPNAVLRGIVMSEVLTRPAQRKWGRLPARH